MIPSSDQGRAVSAIALADVASELQVPLPRAVEAARTVGLFMLRLGAQQQLYISPIGAPRIRKVLAARAGRRVRA